MSHAAAKELRTNFNENTNSVLTFSTVSSVDSCYSHPGRWN